MNRHTPLACDERHTAVTAQAQTAAQAQVDYIRALVDTAPPLSAAQGTVLRRAFRGLV